MAKCNQLTPLPFKWLINYLHLRNFETVVPVWLGVTFTMCLVLVCNSFTCEDDVAEGNLYWFLFVELLTCRLNWTIVQRTTYMDSVILHYQLRSPEWNSVKLFVWLCMIIHWRLGFVIFSAHHLTPVWFSLTKTKMAKNEKITNFLTKTKTKKWCKLKRN